MPIRGNMHYKFLAVDRMKLHSIRMKLQNDGDGGQLTRWAGFDSTWNP
jgi:hypothetical protein